MIEANVKQALSKPRIMSDHIELGYTGSSLVAVQSLDWRDQNCRSHPNISILLIDTTLIEGDCRRTDDVFQQSYARK